MKVKCTNKKCFHAWDYKGKSKGYISCSKCHFRIMLRKALVSPKQKKTLFPFKIPFRKAHISPVLKEKPRVDIPLPSKIAGVNMHDGKVLPRDELPELS